MESIKGKLQSIERYKRPTTKANSRRATIIEQILQKVNTEERAAAGFKKVTPARLGAMVAHLSTDELDAFYNEGVKHYKGPFSKYFFGALKVKK